MIVDGMAQILERVEVRKKKTPQRMKMHRLKYFENIEKGMIC